jgi:hypothetical protein
MPEAIGLVNQQSDGAGMHRLAAACEALEGQRRCGRSARIKVGRVELAREPSDHTPRPTVERMGLPVACFFGILKNAPLRPAREPEQHDGCRIRGAGHRLEFTRLRMKGTAYRETAHGAAPTELIEYEQGEA